MSSRRLLDLVEAGFSSGVPGQDVPQHRYLFVVPSLRALIQQIHRLDDARPGQGGEQKRDFFTIVREEYSDDFQHKTFWVVSEIPPKDFAGKLNYNTRLTRDRLESGWIEVQDWPA